MAPKKIYEIRIEENPAERKEVARLKKVNPNITKEELSAAVRSKFPPTPEQERGWSEFAARMQSTSERIRTLDRNLLRPPPRYFETSPPHAEPSALREEVTTLRREFDELLEEVRGIAKREAVVSTARGTTTANDQQRTLVPWNDTASLLAYLLTELIEAEYITPPPNGRRTGKKGNRAAVADLAYQLFDIRDEATRERVKPGYFRSLMKPKSPDRTGRPDLFRIRPRVARNGPT